MSVRGGVTVSVTAQLLPGGDCPTRNRSGYDISGDGCIPRPALRRCMATQPDEPADAEPEEQQAHPGVQPERAEVVRGIDPEVLEPEPRERVQHDVERERLTESQPES